MPQGLSSAPRIFAKLPDVEKSRLVPMQRIIIWAPFGIRLLSLVLRFTPVAYNALWMLALLVGCPIALLCRYPRVRGRTFFGGLEWGPLSLLALFPPFRPLLSYFAMPL